VERIRILIADDHPVFRFGLRALCLAEPDIELVGEAQSGEDAVAQTEALQPDVVVMDLNMPGMNGIEATRQIVTSNPQIGVLVVTMFEDDDSVFAAIRAGARGYLLKGGAGDEAVRAIRVVAAGEAIFGPAIAQRLIEYFAAGSRDRLHALPPAAFPDLTEREREVLDLIARGLTNTTIAERLSLSPKTVRNHVSNVFSKLQVAGRAQAIVRAREAGLGNGNGQRFTRITEA
jgi:DNA-binding NarL/FixJ family response regulator